MIFKDSYWTNWSSKDSTSPILQSLTPQHLTKWPKLPKPQNSLNTQDPSIPDQLSNLHFISWSIIPRPVRSFSLLTPSPPLTTNFLPFYRPAAWASVHKQQGTELARKDQKEILSIHPLGPYNMLVPNIENRDYCAQRLWDATWCPRWHSRDQGLFFISSASA